MGMRVRFISNSFPHSIKLAISYRNYLMACASLMDQQIQPMYFPHLDSPRPPGVLNLQRLLEEAWEKGRRNISTLASSRRINQFRGRLRRTRCKGAEREAGRYVQMDRHGRYVSIHVVDMLC